jgi:hypothetical protein
MKKQYIICLIILALFSGLQAQINYNLGVGYFGQTLTHPGVVLEAEIEYKYSEVASIPLRLDVGFFVHPRNQTGLFLDLNTGMRRYFKSGLFLEESIGIGILQSFIHSEGVFKVDESGSVTEASRANPVDFMPSLTLGIGYNLTRHSGKQNLIWLRPKVYWQLPHKMKSTYNFALQVGYTHTIKSK